MPEVLAILIGLVALAVALWLAYTALGQVRQLRRELDQTQGQLNDTRQSLSEARGDLAHLQQELSELKAAAEVIPPPPPPLPRARSGGLEDLREQLRAAHREEDESSPDD